jgi:hypothetical protein
MEAIKVSSGLPDAIERSSASLTISDKAWVSLQAEYILAMSLSVQRSSIGNKQIYEWRTSHETFFDYGFVGLHNSHPCSG